MYASTTSASIDSLRMHREAERLEADHRDLVSRMKKRRRAKQAQRRASAAADGEPSAVDSEMDDERRIARALSRLDSSLAPQQHCDQCPYDQPLADLQGFPYWRAKVHMVLDDPYHSVLSQVISGVIMFLIFASTVAFCLETLPSLRDDDAFFYMEMFVVIIFSLEYVGRVTTARNVPKFIVQPLNVIDFFAILPFYIELGSSESDVKALRVFRIVRLARVFRVLKLSRYSSYMRIMARALRRSADAFGLLLFFIVVAVIIFSSVLFFAERDVEDTADRENPFVSIPATFYWCIVTMTTVGYGDEVPVTDTGKLIASVTMVCGILVIALPVSILGSNFQEVYALHQNTNGGTKRPLTGVDDDEPVPEAQAELMQHIEALRAHRAGLDSTLSQLRQMLRARAGRDSELLTIWSTVDFVILNGLSRIEQYLQTVTLESGEMISTPMPEDDNPASEAEAEDESEVGAADAVRIRNVRGTNGAPQTTKIGSPEDGNDQSDSDG